MGDMNVPAPMDLQAKRLKMAKLSVKISTNVAVEIKAFVLERTVIKFVLIMKVDSPVFAEMDFRDLRLIIRQPYVQISMNVTSIPA